MRARLLLVGLVCQSQADPPRSALLNLVLLLPQAAALAEIGGLEEELALGKKAALEAIEGLKMHSRQVKDEAAFTRQQAQEEHEVAMAQLKTEVWGDVLCGALEDLVKLGFDFGDGRVGCADGVCSKVFRAWRFVDYVYGGLVAGNAHMS